MRGPSAVRRALLGVDDLQHVELGDFGDRPVAPCGDEDGAEVALGDLAAALLCQLVGDEGFRDGGERMLDPQRPLTGCLLTGLGLDNRRVDALVDQAAPFACGAPRFLQRDRAIGADGAPGRCRTRCEPGVQDEGDAPGLAAPRRVGILGVADRGCRSRGRGRPTPRRAGRAVPVEATAGSGR